MRLRGRRWDKVCARCGFSALAQARPLRKRRGIGRSRAARGLWPRKPMSPEHCSCQLPNSTPPIRVLIGVCRSIPMLGPMNATVTRRWPWTQLPRWKGKVGSQGRNCPRPSARIRPRFAGQETGQDLLARDLSKLGWLPRRFSYRFDLVDEAERRTYTALEEKRRHGTDRRYWSLVNMGGSVIRLRRRPQWGQFFQIRISPIAGRPRAAAALLLDLTPIACVATVEHQRSSRSRPQNPAATGLEEGTAPGNVVMPAVRSSRSTGSSFRRMDE